MVPEKAKISLCSGIPESLSKIALRDEKWNDHKDIGRFEEKKSDIGTVI